MVFISWVFSLSILHFLIQMSKAEFVSKTFSILPYYAKVSSQMFMQVQVTHPPGPFSCECTLISDTSKKEIYKNTCVNGIVLTDYNLKNITFKLNVENVPLQEPYYKINYHCKYYCGNQAWHEIERNAYLIIYESPYHPKFEPKNNFINNNTKDLVEFMNQSTSQQLANLDSRIDDFLNKTDNPNGFLQKSILLSELFSVSDCLKNTSDYCTNYLRKSQNLIINRLENILDCNKIEDLIFKDLVPERVLSLSALSLVYQTANPDAFFNQSFHKAVHISQCLTSKGFSLLNKLNITLKARSDLFKNITEDYLTSLTYTSSNSLEILKSLYSNVTTEKNDSLVIDDNTTKIKELIEDNSLLISKNNFTTLNESIRTDNLVFFNRRFFNDYNRSSKSLQGMVMRNTLESNYLSYDSFIIDNNSTKINVSLPIYYIMDKLDMQSANIGAILYNKYPLLSANNKNYSNNVISLRLYNNGQEQEVNDLLFPVNIVFERASPMFNVCLYYDSLNQTWNNKNCRSVEISSTQILCQCNHLTDFTISTFNPIYIYDDIVNIFNDTNWMTDLDEFKNLNLENATVIYIYSILISLYVAGLFFTLKYDYTRDSYFLDLSHIRRPSLCDRICSRRKIINDIVTIKFQTENILIPAKKKKIKEHFQTQMNTENSSNNDSNDSSNMKTRRLTVMSDKLKLNDNLEIEFDNIIERRHSSEISEFKKNLYDSFNIDKSDKLVRDSRLSLVDSNTRNEDLNLLDSSFKFKMSFYRNLLAVAQVLRQNNIYTALFSDIEYKLNKTDTLTLIFFNISTSFAVCGLFSPSNSKSGSSDETSYGYKYFNRSIAVSVITIIIVHIPTKIISMILRKKEVYKGEKKKTLVLVFSIIMRVFFYFFMLGIFLLGFINTTWIYLRNKRVARDNVFVDYYFIMLIIKLIGKLVIFFTISAIVCLIIKNPKVPKWKIVIIFLSVILMAVS